MSLEVSADSTPRPYTLVAELTYRCPLRCAYCSNPVSLGQTAEPMGASDWVRVIREAEALGVVQVHFTGGEPLLYDELELLVAEARAADLYVNLISSGLPLARDSWRCGRRGSTTSSSRSKRSAPKAAVASLVSTRSSTSGRRP